MKKFKHLILILFILTLSSCYSYVSDRLGLSDISFYIQDNISVPIDQFDEYNWTDVIKIVKNKKEIESPEIKVSLSDGKVSVNEVCKLKVEYNENRKTYSKQFYVRIISNQTTIKQVKSIKSEANVILTGTVSLVDNTGYILSDNTDSIYVLHEDASIDITKGECITLSGVYNFDCGHFVISSSNTSSTLENVAYAPINKTNDEMISFIDSYPINPLTQNITFEATVVSTNNSLLLNIEDRYIEVNSNDLESKLQLINYAYKTVSITGWIYKYNPTTNQPVIMIEKVNYQVNENIVGETPTIDLESQYYSYSSIEAVKNLTSYFSVYDKEDGKIVVTTSMIEGSVSEGENIITINVKDSDNNYSTASIIISVGSQTKQRIRDSLDEVNPNCMPSEGNVKVLVIPIAFKNYPATSEMIGNLNYAFFGNEKTTGWESLKTYYQKSSYGKLNISGTITDWYTPKYSQDYYAKYEDEDDYIYGSTILMTEALEYYKSKYNYSDYDSNNDGYIDAVYLIYNTEIGGSISSYDDDFYWAYTYWDIYADKHNYSSVKGMSYVFMSYYFFLEKPDYSNQSIKLNCETLIHETGHLMNLTDYYDYDTNDSNNNQGGYGGCDMMDYNIGDHGPFSKLLLNWIDPIVVERDGIYEIPSFTTSGITLLIRANDTFVSIYDEYYLIDFYTFDGLNKLQMSSFFQTNKSYAGVRVSYVNAALKYQKGYYPVFLYDNTETTNKIIRMLEADYKGTFHVGTYNNPTATLSDFYLKGDSFGTNYYATYRSSAYNEIPFIMEVLDITSNKATIKITFK